MGRGWKAEVSIGEGGVVIETGAEAIDGVEVVSYFQLEGRKLPSSSITFEVGK